MASFIKNLKESGLRLAVASSSPYSMIVRTVRDIGLEPYFDRLVSGEDVPQPKPAPDVFQKAMEELGVRPEECVIVEDSSNGCGRPRPQEPPASVFPTRIPADRIWAWRISLWRALRSWIGGLWRKCTAVPVGCQ